MRKDLEERLLRQTHLTSEQLSRAKEEQKKIKKSLFSTLIKLGYLTEEDIYTFFAQQTQIPLVRLSDYELNPELMSLFSEEFYRENLLVPLFKVDNTLFIAMANPLKADLIKELKVKTELEVFPLFSLPTTILKAIDNFFGPEDELYNLEEYLTHSYSSKSNFIFCRESERLQANLPVEIKVTDNRIKLISSAPISATVCDISQSGKGMGVKTFVFLPPGIELSVKFFFKNSEYIAKAQVVRCNMLDKGEYFLGIKFLEVDKDFIKEVINTLSC